MLRLNIKSSYRLICWETISIRLSKMPNSSITVSFELKLSIKSNIYQKLGIMLGLIYKIKSFNASESQQNFLPLIHIHIV